MPIYRSKQEGLAACLCLAWLLVPRFTKGLSKDSYGNYHLDQENSCILSARVYMYPESFFQLYGPSWQAQGKTAVLNGVRASVWARCD